MAYGRADAVAGADGAGVEAAAGASCRDAGVLQSRVGRRRCRGRRRRR
ncbi:MAG: hypothetical protein HXK06_01130 [Actinomyces graevenitzii]|nr:hypothetical protein [Actinomyces graevenitzii]